MVGDEPSAIGARAEMAVLSALQRRGMDVFVPLCGAHGRTDVIVGREGELLKVQVKTSRLGNGFLSFDACSRTANFRTDYRGQVDAFGVYSPDLNLVYLVPVEDAPVTACHLRLEPTKNNQASKVRWAADYLIGPP